MMILFNLFNKYIYKYQQKRGKVSVFHVVRSKRFDLIYLPIPKNMCSTLKHALYTLENNTEFTTDDKKTRGNIHEFFFNNSHNYLQKNKFVNQKSLKFVVVREPIERFLSAYRNRVLDLNDLADFNNRLDLEGLNRKPEINYFIENLFHYQGIVPSILHHTIPQNFFTGTDLSIFDKIYNIKDHKEILILLKSLYPDIYFKKEKSGGTKVDMSLISISNIEKLRNYYSDDYKLFENYI
jgi:hypothetical protein